MRFTNYDAVISHKYTHTHTHTHTYEHIYTAPCSHEESYSVRSTKGYVQACRGATNSHNKGTFTDAQVRTHPKARTCRGTKKHGSRNRPRKTNPKTDRNTQTHRQKNRHQQHRNKYGKQGKQTHTHTGTPTHKQRANKHR